VGKFNQPFLQKNLLWNALMSNIKCILTKRIVIILNLENPMTKRKKCCTQRDDYKIQTNLNSPSADGLGGKLLNHEK